jgi:hypothetical protein
MIESTSSRRTYAACAALVAWAALAVQLWLTVGIVLAQGRGFFMSLVVFFGFFTVLTNLLAALVMTGHAAGPGPSFGFSAYKRATSPVVMTTTAASITIVCAVYFLVLRHLWKPEGAQFWADVALHYVVPILVVVFWAWTVPARALGWKDVPWLFAYPLLYLVYVFVRGEIVHLYPYPFIDVLSIGYRAALLNTAGILLAYALVVGLFCVLKAVFSRATSRMAT